MRSRALADAMLHGEKRARSNAAKQNVDVGRRKDSLRKLTFANGANMRVPERRATSTARADTRTFMY
jgi:hypothetical protein